MDGRRTRWMALSGVVALLAAGACTSDPGTGPGRAGGGPGTIPQPVVTGLPVGPEQDRVDLAMPTFSNPTDITNPLFPVSRQRSVLLLGEVDGKAFRTEVTLLPGTRVIDWRGQRVETLVSQYVAFLDGRIHEVAYDLYAQADDGSVWYFGEDVFNFRDGSIADTHGTWIAGRDGPAAMIMPADPQVGDIYRPENIPGFVFEEVTVRSVGRSLDGPLGPVDGGLVVEELHMDGGTEGKTFAPGYGEFLTASGGDVEALAMAVPTDAATGPVPEDVSALEAAAGSVFEAAGAGDWARAQAGVSEMLAAWNRVEAGEVPGRIGPLVDETLAALTGAVGARDAATAQQAAIEAARWSFDLQLRYRPTAEVDLARFDLWAAQLVVDAAVGDPAAVDGDLFAMDYVRDRILHALAPDDLTNLNQTVEELQIAVGERDLPAAAGIATDLREILAGMRVVG